MYVEDECKFYPADSVPRVLSRYKGHTVRDSIVVKKNPTLRHRSASVSILFGMLDIRPPHSPPTANFKDLKWFLMSF